MTEPIIPKTYNMNGCMVPTDNREPAAPMLDLNDPQQIKQLRSEIASLLNKEDNAGIEFEYMAVKVLLPLLDTTIQHIQHMTAMLKMLIGESRFTEYMEMVDPGYIDRQLKKEAQTAQKETPQDG